jgi:hypothetical protein
MNVVARRTLLFPPDRQRPIGPEPHPNFIEVFCGLAVGGGAGAVERAGEDAENGLFRAQPQLTRSSAVPLAIIRALKYESRPRNPDRPLLSR